jgi:prevent-host-death family protein
MEVLRIGVPELGQNVEELLAWVKAGETVEITERGVLVARLVPAQLSESARDRHIAADRMIPATGSRHLPQPMSVDGPSTAEVLDELREDRV